MIRRPDGSLGDFRDLDYDGHFARDYLGFDYHRLRVSGLREAFSFR